MEPKQPEDFSKINSVLDRIKATAGHNPEPPPEEPEKVETVEYVAIGVFLLVVALAIWSTIPH